MMQQVKRLPEITIIIPHRETEGCKITLDSLAEQTFQDFWTITMPDKGKGANWARNEGFKYVNTEFVLFSDNDIEWKSHALETLLRVLKMTPKASYSYGRYRINDQIWSHQAWDPYMLRAENYISTMSLIRTKDFPGFDENIRRLQDWDLWLTMLGQGKRGVYCEDLIFETKERPGITHDANGGIEGTSGVNYLDAILTVRKKHGLDTTKSS